MHVMLLRKRLLLYQGRNPEDIRGTLS